MCVFIKIQIFIVGILMPICLFAQLDIYNQPLHNENDRYIAELLKENLSDQYCNTWNIGSAKKLEGEIYILTIWLTKPGTKWNYKQMCKLQSSIDEAKEWLIKTAKDYGKKVYISSGCFAGNNYEGIEMDGLPTSYKEAAAFKPLLPRALKTIGYNDVMHCYNQLCERFNADNVIVLVMINNDGWSCSYDFSKGHATYGYHDYFLENAYIFRSNDGKTTGSQTIVHEIMHLFGAWDMYYGQATNDAGTWASKYYPNEIMLQTTDPLYQLTISPLTAWLTGLSEKYETWFWKFIRVNKS